MDSFNVMSICSGIDGIGLGLGLCLRNSRTVCHVENSAYACAVLAARMQESVLDPAPIWSDLRTFDGCPWRGAVDCVTAGFPCPPVSLAGRRAGIHDPRWLWPDVWRIIREVGPRWVFLENVPGLLSANDGAAFGEVLRDLAQGGYDAEWDLFSASQMGAPHIRQRVFVLAHASEYGWDTWRQSDVEKSEARRQSDRSDFDDTGPDTCKPGPSLGKGVQQDPSNEFEIAKRIRGDGSHAQSERQGQRRRLKLSEVREKARDFLWPRSESGIQRMVNGVPQRVERLICIGNAVCPSVAATAFAVLWERINDRHHQASPDA